MIAYLGFICQSLFSLFTEERGRLRLSERAPFCQHLPCMLFPPAAHDRAEEGGALLAALFWEFFFYSLCGFLLEIAFARLVHHPKRDRKCHLILPVCPVYGVGALAILLLPGWVKASPLFLYLGGALAATVAEWALAVFYEKVGQVRFWDYRDLRWNLQGRVCLPFSLYWGVLSLLLVYLVHPLLAPLFSAVPSSFTIPAALFYLGDAGVSLLLLRRRGTEGLRWYTRFIPSEAR